MEKQESKIERIERHIEESSKKFQERWKELNENLDLGKAGPMKDKGGWHIEVGTRLSLDGAFGPLTESEIEANRRKPLQERLSELYP